MLNNAADGFLFEMHLPNMTKDGQPDMTKARPPRSQSFAKQTSTNHSFRFYKSHATFPAIFRTSEGCTSLRRHVRGLRRL